MHEALAKANFEADVAKVSDEAALRVGLEVHSRAFPILDLTIQHKRPLRLRLTCQSWDELPPSIELLNPDGSHLSGQIPGDIFNGSAHPSTNRPFICMRGSREYHMHSSHLTDLWENYRGQDGMNLFGIAMQISHAWRRTNP